MIIRIVKMIFVHDHIDAFNTLFKERMDAIRNFNGCAHLELWQDAAQKNIFFTYSHWETEDHLEQYRRSDFFKDTWSKTKVFFAERAEAWSVIKTGN